MAENQQIQDPSLQGTGGLRGLDGLNRLKEQGVNIDTSIFNLAKDYKGTMRAINESSTPTQDVGFVGVNDSMFDEGISSVSQLDNLANTRGELQPWYSQVGAGLAKGALLAGTTFLDGTLGLLVGAGTAIDEGRLSGLWDNDFSKAMQSVNEWSEEAMPNYYTDAEREEPWYENIFTANFIGDKFIKNSGFAVGAFYSGNSIKKALNLHEIIGAVTKSSKAPAIVASGVGATISAVNEGRVQALNNSNDWFELQKLQLDDQHKARLQAIESNYAGTEMYPQLMALENENYEATLGRITEDRLKMGNMDMLTNLPILTASNIIQFGKLYANGFKTARKTTDIVGKAGEYATSKTTAKGVIRASLNPLSEGTEEVLQSASGRIAGNYYADDVNNFYKAKIDPTAEQETVSYIKAFAKGINETVNDASSWEEFFIGALTGTMGMLRFRGIRNEQGGIQSPVTLERGLLGEFRAYKEAQQREENIANYMNERVQSPKFINYYQGLIRHNKYQNDMNQAVEDNNEFEFKNAEHRQFISDTAMFDNAGRLEDLTTLINSAYDTSDANLQSIVDNTTSTITDASGKESKVGPFIDKNGNPMFSTPEGKQKMIAKLTQTKNEMLSTITEYTKIRDDIDVRTGQRLDDTQLEELTWLKSQIGNWNDRAAQLSSEVKPTIETVLGSMSQLANMYNSIKNEEGMRHAGLSELYINADNGERQIRKNMSLLKTIQGLDNKILSYVLAKDPKLVKGIKSVIENPLSGIAADDAQVFSKKVDDIVKLVDATTKFNSKLKEYLSNPTKLQEDIVESTETIAKDEAKKKTDNLKANLQNTNNLSEFRGVLDTFEDAVVKEETLKALEDEGNTLAKNYKEVNAYNTDVLRVINSLDEDAESKAGAIKLLQDQFENSNSLEEMANPNSIYVDNADALLDPNLSEEDNIVKFQNAQYTLLTAMNQVNNDNRFKDRFSKDYRDLREKGTPSTSAPTSDTTGDSGTSTIPSSNGDGLPVDTYEPPVGNITSTQVQEDNKQTNDRTETPQSLDNTQAGRRPYYRPAIPELHIQGSKEGDFRPFNVVVAERENGVNFDEIYNYLKDNGAFDYVNEGNLSKGSELGFMIDPEFNDHTIFIVDRKNNQIVGSLDESQYSVDRYEGLKELKERIIQEYSRKNHPRAIDDSSVQETKKTDSQGNITIKYTVKNNAGRVVTLGGVSFNSDVIVKDDIEAFWEEGGLYDFRISELRISPEGKSAGTISFRTSDGMIQRGMEVRFHSIPIIKSSSENKFIATPSTRVSQMMVGKIPYGTEDRSLANIPNVRSEGNPPIFGIVKNGTLSTNGKLNDSDVIKPVDMKLKEGRLYLLIPNAKGMYSPAAVKVKHFNSTEFNLEDVEVQNTDMYKNIQESISNLANALNEDDLTNAVRTLKRDLYIGDLHIDWFTSNAGNGIRFTKVQRDAQGNEAYEERDGKRLRKEEVKTVFFYEEYNQVQTEPQSKSSDTITKEITDLLLGFNLPIQVNLGMINKTGYNNMLVNSNVLTSNITDARVISSWFTTDYFDISGNLQNAFSPASVTPEPARKVETPVGGTEGAISGIKINSVFSGKDYYVDLTNNTIKDSNGKNVPITDSNRVLLDLTYAESNYGDATQGSFMYNNKVLLPNGQVLDRDKQTYLYGGEAEMVKGAIAMKEISAKEKANNSKKTISEIAENQKKVDKTRTDGEYYYILEEDGQYHEYERVHTRLGSNWVESKKQTDALKDTRVKLSQLSDNITQYNNYLKNLSNHYKVDLSAFEGKVDARSRDTVVNVIRDKMSGTNSQRALNAGSAVDSVIRNFFSSNDTPIKPDNMSDRAFTDLVSSLTEIRTNIEARGERFLTNNIVLFNKYEDGTRIAGEVDILSVDEYGNFRIYDVKTSRYSFYDFTDSYGNPTNYFNNKSNTQVMSSRDYYSLQLSAYRNLFESQYHTPITTLAILPFVLNYNKDIVDSVSKEKGIMVTYNPAVNVPLKGATTQAPQTLPIYNSALETQDPINHVLPEYSLEDSEIGYFEVNGKLHKGYISKIGEVNGIEVFVTKTPNITKGFGKGVAHIASNNYIAVFSNGNTFPIALNQPINVSEKDIKSQILSKLSGNPNRVAELANAETSISKTAIPVTPEVKEETPITILDKSTVSGAAKTIQAEQAINESDPEFEDDIDLGSLRQVDMERPIWDKEKELSWINRVLPQLAEGDRVRVVKGLIRVAELGADAWGQFNNGIITLSDISAEGTTYHEAFHAVFQLLLDQKEQQSLLEEARNTYGNKSDSLLEEDMAEGFREYVMSRESAGLGKKIINFFKDLFTKVTHWGRIKPSLTEYYRNINEGKYNSSKFKVSPLNSTKESINTSFESVGLEIQETLLNKGWTQDKFDSISQQEREQAVKCLGL